MVNRPSEPTRTHYTYKDFLHHHVWGIGVLEKSGQMDIFRDVVCSHIFYSIKTEHKYTIKNGILTV